MFEDSYESAAEVEGIYILFLEKLDEFQHIFSSMIVNKSVKKILFNDSIFIA